MNDDGDFLPIAAMPIYFGAIPSLPTPAHAGREFSARMEIRGFGECLNDALSDHFPDGVQNPCAVANAHSEKIYTNPNEDTKSTLTYLEYLAWLDFSLAKGVDATDERNFSQWSPERPSDPTKADTDEDGIDDGIEYWFWYRAHVGYMDGAIHKYETGRRLNSASGANGEKIASTEIEKIMDPVVANKSWASDTDGDGLGDSVELQINTNPFDFDTDDDGLPDGYEICVTKTDPLSALTLDEESGRMVKDYDCFVAVGTTNDYSGQSYSITVVNRKTGGGCPWTVYYAEAENGPYTTEKPNYCKVGVYTNWCYVSAIDGSVSFRGATQMAVVDVREVPIAGSEVVDGRTWTYRIYKGMATAVSVNPANGLVQIPLTLGGFSVVSIGEGAFENCRDLTAVMIPVSVQRIGSCAFSGCEALKDVYFLGDCPMSDGAVFEGCCPVPHVVLLSNISKETVDNAEPHVIMSVAGQDLSMDVYGAVCRYVGVELRKPIVPDVLSPANVKSIEIKNGKAKLGIQIEMTSSLECPNWKPVDVTPETLEIQLPTELQGFIRLQSK